MTLTETFAALSDQNRQKILDTLKKGELSVSDILKHMDITMATLSHHLEVLRRCDLVSSRRLGQQILYSLNLSVIEELEKEIIKFFKIKSSKK